MKTLLVLLLASVARATDYPIAKQIYPSDLQAQIIAAGMTLDGIHCVSGNCVAYNVSADPSAVIAAYVYVAPTPPGASISLVGPLVIALRGGTATQAQKDQLLALLVAILLGK